MHEGTGTPSKGKPILSLRNISKKFGAVSALTDIELDVYGGEVVALVGDNGAGKSTLIKILAGVHQPTSGTIEFDGREVTLNNPGTALDMGIATVFQDLALCENLDVVANLFLGHELSPYRLDEVQMEVRAWTLLKELAARIPSVREPIASLSGGTSEMRNIVPFGAGWSWRGPAMGSGSFLPMGMGDAFVFQISCESWPGRSGLLWVGAGLSETTIAFPFLSWPVTTRLTCPIALSRVTR